MNSSKVKSDRLGLGVPEFILRILSGYVQETRHLMTVKCA